MMTSAEIREAFLQYFAAKGHSIVSSSSLVPANDPTLLFTNAGMVQFKEVFLGQEKRDYVKATSSQRCVRAGGKHNDLENVGYTARHHTFFEMLGNFSFGDYFKKEAIEYAWDLLTNVFKLPPEKLWVTVYKDDTEARDIWLQDIKVDPERFSYCGEKDNFWSMGDTGPCGPCTEIFYDHGEMIPGGPPGSADEDGDRYVEIWNLVFMQYNRSVDGELTPLPRPSVDTGMGLERLAAVLQGVHSNYDIDLFVHLIKKAAVITGAKDLTEPSLRVIADHIRSCAFLILDGVMPANEGRGYVLRRIIRRAVRHGAKLGVTPPFFYKLVDTLVEEMGGAYPELSASRDRVIEVIQQEEEQFARTLSQGLKILDDAVAELSGSEIPGETLFQLYDTYGFPVDMVADIARERQLTLDMAGFDACMEKQRSQARAASQFQVDLSDTLKISEQTKFCGYDKLKEQGEVLALVQNTDEVESLKVGDTGIVVMSQTPFYAESGGQVGDKGTLRADGIAFVVEDTQKAGHAVLHIGRVAEGEITKGIQLSAEVDALKRQATVLNHSATHLMHAALRQVLGSDVTQKGSLVDDEKLRFDFSYTKAVSPQDLRRVENMVNEQIRANHPVQTELMSPADAEKAGAMALFGEKYGDEVRVLSMGSFSKELCGGTHAERTGDIGFFKILAEVGIAAGVRRIEAITGEKALRWAQQTGDDINELSTLLKTHATDIKPKLKTLLEQNKQLEKQLQQLKSQLTQSAGDDLLKEAKQIGDINVLSAHFEGVDAKSLRDTADRMKDKLGNAVVVLASINSGKISLVSSVTKACSNQYPAGELIKHIASQISGKGGGRPDMAQGGGTDVQALPGALKGVYSWVEDRASANGV